MGLTSERWCTSKVEKSVTDPVGTCKVGIAGMDEQLRFFKKELLRNVAPSNCRLGWSVHRFNLTYMSSQLLSQMPIYLTHG